MTSYVLDSWAWVEYLRGTKKGQVVKTVFERGDEVYTNSVTIAELISKFKREQLDFENAWRAVTTMSKPVVVKETDSKEAGLIHASVKSKSKNFSLADAYVLQTAKKLGCRILTGDPDFKEVGEAHMLT
jgi:predicted nucleic acid-binding protein